MKIIDIPQKHSKEDYKEAVDKHVAYFSKLKNVKSIYQIGGVSTPGVSDIDLIIVFKNESYFKKNPRIVNNTTANYLFTHSLYGVSENDFNNSLKYTFFHNHVLLYGKTLDLNNYQSNTDQLLLKKQIALEFLVKMYVNLGVQKSYKTIKLRSIFLHVKALLYDFDFLNIYPEPVVSLVNQGIEYRNSWFEKNISDNDIELWFKAFYNAYEIFLEDVLNDHKFFASESAFKISPNINIAKSDIVRYKRKGIVFPDILSLMKKKHVKLLNKMNNFHFEIPMDSDAPNIIIKYFDYAKKVNNYNKLYLPNFMPLTSSLKMYNK